MKCDWPQIVIRQGQQDKNGKVYKNDVSVRCGKCYNCKITRLRGWVFRLRKEEQISCSSYFVTLTYDSEYVPITPNGFLTLYKKDLQRFFKRLRKNESEKRKNPLTGRMKTYYNELIKYYAVGEYGTQNKRPHYHIILMGVKNELNIEKSWKRDGNFIGDIHIGTVTQASIAYTAEYIGKPQIVPIHNRDDRQKEFSLYSQGIGLNYLTDRIKKYHQDRPTQMYLTDLEGEKLSMPKYYRNKIFDEKTKIQQGHYISKVVKEEEEQQRIDYLKKHPEGDYDNYLRMTKVARLNKLNKKSNKK